ncbi:MAG: hypothetical protein K8T90_15275 [Planctomycetes bacterium]|nr:hypothetical protein [Planctomycetota bacterium]
MATKISIRFDGTTPGLADGRLSLGSFLPALNELLTALRRIGSNIIVAASEQSERGGKGGRLAKDAEVLDLEITNVHHNCLVIEMVSTAHPRAGANQLLFNDLPEMAGDELLSSLEAESKGRMRNKRVREYFGKLPAGIANQRYELSVDDKPRRAIEITTIMAAQEAATLPGLREFVTKAEGVMFSRPKIRLRETGGSAQWYVATQHHLDTVIANRSASFRVMVLFGEGVSPKILRLSVGEAAFPPISQETRHRRVFQDWAGVLKRLA